MEIKKESTQPDQENPEEIQNPEDLHDELSKPVNDDKTVRVEFIEEDNTKEDPTQQSPA